MKKFYHLLSYKLRVKLPRLASRATPSKFEGDLLSSHLLPLTSYLIPLFAFCFLPSAALAQFVEAELTQIYFSCPGTITITYDIINAHPNVDSVVLYYSSDKCMWIKAKTEYNVQPGTDLTITWNAADAGVIYGKFYYKVEYSVQNCKDKGGVEINGVCWAKTNLDDNGEFCENPWDYGALYQWGRNTDGHQSRTSVTYPCDLLPPDSEANGQLVTPLTAANLDINGQPTGTVDVTSATNCPDPALFVSDKFIKNNIAPIDWRDPQCDTLWNSGTIAVPVKTVNDPCPDTWRLPTRTDLQRIGNVTNETYVKKEWIEDYLGNGINGYLLTDQVNNANTIFLPAAGYRSYRTASIGNTNQNIYYWSSIANSSSGNAYNLNINLGESTNYRAYGMSVRCVLEQ